MEKLNVESRLNELLEKKLRAGTLPFTFSRAELLEGSYADRYIFVVHAKDSYRCIGLVQYEIRGGD